MQPNSLINETPCIVIHLQVDLDNILIFVRESVIYHISASLYFPEERDTVKTINCELDQRLFSAKSEHSPKTKMAPVGAVTD